MVVVVVGGLVVVVVVGGLVVGAEVGGLVVGAVVGEIPTELDTPGAVVVVGVGAGTSVVVLGAVPEVPGGAVVGTVDGAGGFGRADAPG